MSYAPTSYCTVALEKKKKKKKLGKKTEGEKKERKKTMERGRIEPPSHVSISLKSPMPYPSPTVTIKLHCEPVAWLEASEPVLDFYCDSDL